MLTTRTFKPSTNARVHVLHESKTDVCYGHLVSLCGKQFPRRVEPSHAKATCPSCLKLDNPFELSNAQTVKFWKTLRVVASTEQHEDLVKRDLIHTVTGLLTPRGHALAADLQQHPPWAGLDGVVHARNGIAWRRAVCGADLIGVNEMSYAKLARLLAVGEQSRVTCIECMVTSP